MAELVSIIKEGKETFKINAAGITANNMGKITLNAHFIFSKHSLNTFIEPDTVLSTENNVKYVKP